MSKAFKKTLLKARDKYEKGKEVKTGGGYFDPPEGIYNVRVKAQSDDVERDNRIIPVVRIGLTFVEGNFKGKVYSHTIWFDDEGKGDIQWSFDELFRMLKVVLPDIDVDEVEPEDIEDLLEQLSEEAPLVEIAVKKKPGKNNRVWTSIYFNERVSEDNSEEEDEEVEDESPEDDEDTREEDSVEDDTEEEEIEKGDTVTWSEDEEDYTVVTLNRRKNTATIKNDEERHTNVPLADLALA